MHTHFVTRVDTDCTICLLLTAELSLCVVPRAGAVQTGDITRPEHALDGNSTGAICLGIWIPLIVMNVLFKDGQGVLCIIDETMSRPLCIIEETMSRPS